MRNFGIKDEDIDRQFGICKEVFGLELEEKIKFHDAERFKRGDIRGYRPVGSKLITRCVFFSFF